MKFWNVYADNVLVGARVASYTAKALKHRFKAKYPGTIRVEPVN